MVKTTSLLGRGQAFWRNIFAPRMHKVKNLFTLCSRP